jgi:hypothetical protein
MRPEPTQLTLGIQHLSTFVQGHTPVVDTAKWFAKLDGSPALYVMSMDGTNFNLNLDSKLGNLCTGQSAMVTLDTPFRLAATDVSKLEELTVLCITSLRGESERYSLNRKLVAQ